VLPQDPITRIIVGLPAFLPAIILHEIGHGYIAYRCGDDTAKRMGRLTLSPLPHIDPLGAIVFVITSLAGFPFGWAKPVPVVVERLRNPLRDQVLVTLAGPGANFLQAVVWVLLLRLTAHYLTGSLAQAIATFCYLGLSINVILMLFNLLPIPPLDGSHVAARLLGVRDPHLVDRLAPLGMVVLVLLIMTPAFDAFYSHLVVPVIDLFLHL
jgi:Zn-dependent protease